MKDGPPLFIRGVIVVEFPAYNYVSINKLVNNRPEPYSGHKRERKASKSARLTSLRDMMIGSTSWSRIFSRVNGVEKYFESREKKYRWTQYSVSSTYIWSIERICTIIRRVEDDRAPKM